MSVPVRAVPDARAGVLPRRLIVVLLAAAHLAIPGLAPLLDATPAPPSHQHHVAADSAAGCQAYHADHCALCRILTGEGVGGAPAAGIGLPAPPPAQTFSAAGDTAPERRAGSPVCARAPPAA